MKRTQIIEEMETANERQEDRMDAENSFMCVCGWMLLRFWSSED